MADETTETETDDKPADDAPAAKSSILDLAPDLGDKKDDDNPDDKSDAKLGEYAAPKTIPDHMHGKDADETLANVMKAYTGARKSLSEGKGKLEGDVPDSVDGYKFEAEGDDDKLAEEMNSEESKPVVDAFKKAALDVGIPDKAFNAFMRAGLANAAEAGIPIGISPEEATKISADAEMAALATMMGGEKEAGIVSGTVKAYGDKLIDSGVMTKEDQAVFNDMCGTAECSHLFYKIMTSEFGEKSIPLADPAAGKLTGNDAYALHAKAEAMPDGAQKDEARADAQRSMQKAFGEEKTGSVPSNVL